MKSSFVAELMILFFQLDQTIENIWLQYLHSNFNLCLLLENLNEQQKSHFVYLSFEPVRLRQII